MNKPQDYCFYVSKNREDDYNEYFVSFSPISYFEENHCCYDQHISQEVDIPEPGSEDMESTFSFEGMEREDIRQLLLTNGFLENEEYSKFVSSFEE